MKYAYVYTRVSTEEQAKEGKSIQTQDIICRKWARDNGYSVKKTFVDEGKSATNLNRPALTSLLSACQDNYENISVILVQDTDRLARNTLDHLKIKALLKKCEIQLISVSQPMIDDSPEGNMIDTIIASVNTLQSQLTGRKTSKVLEQKAIEGWFPGGTPPLGYKNTINPSPTTSLDKKIIEVDRSMEAHIIRIFKMYSTGNYTFEDIAHDLNSQGINSPTGNIIHKSYIARVLSDEFYIGYFLWNKKRYKGKHKPILSDNLFKEVQNVIQAHNHYATRKRKHRYLLRGFLVCADCGTFYNAEKHIKKNGDVYDYYYCLKCKKGTYTPISELENKVTKKFYKIEISQEYVKYVLKTAELLLIKSRANRSTERKRLLKEKTEVEKAMRDTEDNRFRLHKISEATFERIYTRYDSLLTQVNKQLEEIDHDYSANIKSLEQILRLAENIGYAYESADYTLKRQYLQLFFKTFLIKSGKIVKIALTDKVKPLVEDGSVRIKANGLPQWDNIRTETWVRAFVFS